MGFDYLSLLHELVRDMLIFLPGFWDHTADRVFAEDDAAGFDWPELGNHGGPSTGWDDVCGGGWQWQA